MIIEGILTKDKYGSMLNKLIKEFDGETHVYYFDISFEETLKRHKTKINSHEFGEEEMKEWWKEKDFLGVEKEKVISDDMRESEIISMIKEDVF